MDMGEATVGCGEYIAIVTMDNSLRIPGQTQAYGLNSDPRHCASVIKQNRVGTDNAALLDINYKVYNCHVMSPIHCCKEKLALGD